MFIVQIYATVTKGMFQGRQVIGFVRYISLASVWFMSLISLMHLHATDYLSNDKMPGLWVIVTYSCNGP